MTLSNDALSTLDALFQLASSDTPATAIRVADLTGVAPADARRSLTLLERRGLADAARCRLTFVGLAIASGRARSSAAPRLVRAA